MNASMNAFSDGYWLSGDGLRLHYRDFPVCNVPGTGDRPPIVCLPGLTRNARDFEQLALRLAGEWRVICPEMRGRGDSGYSKNWASYHPMQYVSDVNALLEQIGITRFVAVGTSLGGLMTIILAMIDRGRIAGALLNDIGPVLEPAGLERIRDYVGQGRNFPTWMHAARALKESQASAFPDFQAADWLAMAKRVMMLNSNGRIVFDYDMKIAEGFGNAATAPELDMWPGIEALAERPVVLVRGGLSDLLSEATFAEMCRRLPDAEAVTLPRIGHAPTLDEPEVVAALDRMLARVR
jgi:pimeloyl-ACP methyl ester carboxylesterase